MAWLARLQDRVATCENLITAGSSGSCDAVKAEWQQNCQLGGTIADFRSRCYGSTGDAFDACKSEEIGLNSLINYCNGLAYSVLRNDCGEGVTGAQGACGSQLGQEIASLRDACTGVGDVTLPWEGGGDCTPRGQACTLNAGRCCPGLACSGTFPNTFCQ